MSMIIDGTNGLTYPGGQLEVGPLTLGTSQASTSGTSITFSGIPSWVKRITVMFNGVSTSGTSNIQVQVGSGSVTTTGYNSGASVGATSATATTGFLIYINVTAADILYGSFTVCNMTGNTWIESGIINNGGYGRVSGGVSPALSGALDRVVITTVNGTDTFDAGSINIMYE